MSMNNKNLLVITGDYFPYPSSNTNCLEPLLEGIEQAGWHIDVVTVRQYLELPRHETAANGREIWRIDDPRSMNTILQNQLRDIPAPRSLKAVNHVFCVISKALFYLHYCLHYPDKRFASWPQDSTMKKCEKLNETRHFSAVLSVSHPVASHEIAKKFINSLSGARPKWFLYEFDPYCYNEHLYGANCYRKLASKQHILFEAADALCMIPELYEFYKTTPFSRYQNKMIPVAFPNMRPVSLDREKAQELPLPEGRTHCVFGGALNDNIRNPLYALRVFAKCGNEISWTILTGYSLKKMISAVPDPNGVIQLFPMQNRDTSYLTMERADVLVNIGNNTSIQTPGKLFEYMAMGKPILHFQQIENDPCLVYLKKYPMVLIINQRENNVAAHAQQIQDFCDKYRGKHLTFSEVSEYIPEYLSDHVVKKFVQQFEKIAISGVGNAEK